MDINKIQFGELAQSKNIDKTFEDLDINSDGKINEEDKTLANDDIKEVISNLLNSTDEDVELADDGINLNGLTQAIDNTKNISNVEETNQVQSTETGATNSSVQQSEEKTMEDYLKIADNLYDELYEKFNGDSEQINQYIKNNMSDYADIDGDGKITLLDTAIWSKALSNTSSYALDPKRVTFTKIKQALLQSTGWEREENLLDLDDLENLFKVCGDWRELGNLGVAIWIKSSLDLSEIAQTENWEERIDNLCKTYGINGNLPCFQGNVKSNLKSYSEYEKNNPETAGYYAVAQGYQYLQEQLSTRDLTSEATSAWEANQGLSEDCDEQNYTITAHYNIIKNQIYEQAVAKAVLNKDINGDGEITASDIASFSTEIDLDGDGTVSCEEKEFLKQVKEKLQTQFYRKSSFQNYYNLSSIDSVISSVETCDESYRNNLKEQKPAYSTVNFETGIDDITEYDDNDIPGYKFASCYLMSLGVWPALVQGLQDGTNPITSYQELSSCTASRLYEIYEEAVDYLSSANLYLHYVKNADLTKCELEEILSKINNASESAQSQLSEVKKVVEEKIAKLE